jgi:OmcA/MtrC family decaheme c-type cytochrome
MIPTVTRLLLLAAAAVSALSAAPQQSAASIPFINPGLTIVISSASVASDGAITVTYTVTDPAGLPLDAAGVNTPGPLKVSYVAAYIPATQDQYIAYTTRTATGAVLATTTQAGADSGGVLTALGSGQYQYIFATKAPADFDLSATHTIGIYGSRNLTTYGFNSSYASTTFNFVPNGSKVTKVRDIIRTANCNGCHDQLSAHGGSRRQVELCILCHTPQTNDPNTGDSADFKVFIHKLHMGSQLPSVVAGGQYALNGSDYSTVVFPADPRRCESCHVQNSGATQEKSYLTNPGAAACGSCHDDVNLATGKNHPGGPQQDDSLCATCHQPQGELEFDASVKGAHVVPADSLQLSGLHVKISGVTNNRAGQAPKITFTVTDNSGAVVSLASLGRISFTMAGPASDLGLTSFGSDVSTPGYVTESATKAICSGATCVYPFSHVVPANATGTYSIGVEARRTETILASATPTQAVTYGAANQVVDFSVDGSPVVPRRTVVATSNCNACHVSLSVHGTLRNQIEYCVLCHNPSNTDLSARPAAVVAADRNAPNQGINFNLMVHRIHYGENQVAAGRNYSIVGFGGSHNDFSDVLYPAMSPTGSAGDTRNCSLCHVNGSEQKLPLGLNAVTDPQGYLNPIQSISSACSGCHVTQADASHMLSNTDSLGESCTVCHASGAAFAVKQVHAQY